MHRIGLVIALTALWNPGIAVASAQTEPISSNGLTVHTYGDLSYENQTAVLDDYAMQLQARPETFAHVVVRSTRDQPPGLAHRKLLTIKNYLVWYKNIAPGRLTLQDGGRGTCFSVELRLVAAPPTIDPDSVRLDADLKETLLYDSWVVVDDEEELIPAQITLDMALLDDLAQLVRTQRQLRSVLIGYARAGARQSGGRRWVTGLLHERKRYLVTKHGISPSRVDVVFGGYRSAPEIEAFVVPRLGAYPRATPTRKPAGRR